MTELAIAFFVGVIVGAIWFARFFSPTPPVDDLRDTSDWDGLR